MSSRTYTGRIWLTSGGHPVDVLCNASSPKQASQIIKAQFGSSFKSWARHMTSK